MSDRLKEVFERSFKPEMSKDLDVKEFISFCKLAIDWGVTLHFPGVSLVYSDQRGKGLTVTSHVGEDRLEDEGSMDLFFSEVSEYKPFISLEGSAITLLGTRELLFSTRKKALFAAMAIVYLYAACEVTSL